MTLTSSACLKQMRALSKRELDHRVLGKEALKILSAKLDTKLVLWATLDPMTLLPTSLFVPGVLHRFVGFAANNFFFKKMVRYDQDPDEILSVSQLAQSSRPYGTLHQATGGNLARCHRYQEMMARLGIVDEMRVLLTDAGQIWGVVSACRRTEPFSDEEISLVAQVGQILGAALRQSLLRMALSATPGSGPTPGLLFFNEAGLLEDASPEAKALLGDDLEHYEDNWLGLLQLNDEGSGTPGHLDVVIKEGAITLHRTWIGGREVLIVERSRQSVLSALLMRAYRLTERESELVMKLCRGLTTVQLAETMSITEWTVQDHLKSIFKKVGVGNRSQLISVLLLQHYLPQHRRGATPSPSGWFLK